MKISIKSSQVTNTIGKQLKNIIDGENMFYWLCRDSFKLMIYTTQPAKDEGQWRSRKITGSVNRLRKYGFAHTS